MMRQLLLTGLVLAGLFPMPGIAQVSAPDLSQKRSKAIARLKPGSLIRVHAQSLGEIVGRYHSSASDSLFISDNMGESGVPIAAIDAIWVRGRATWKGAKIGGIVVGAVGTGVGIVAVSGCDGAACIFDLPILGVGGVIAGGLVGAGLGTAFPKWHRRYRSPDYDPDVYSNFSETDFAIYCDGGVGYSDVKLKAIHPNRLRISIVPDISGGGVNASASIVF